MDWAESVSVAKPMKAMNPILSVVIVSWNTRKLVLDCLDSLVKCQFSVPVEVILVDNASSDNTADYIRKQFPGTRIIENNTNLGFARGNNQGLQVCSGEFIALINSDVVVSDGCLETMVNYMQQQPDVGMLGPKMILRDGSIGKSCYRFPTLWGWFCNAFSLSTVFNNSQRFGDFSMANFKYDQTVDVDILTGWFWMVRKKAIDKIGHLDTQFFMYGEDLDWPKRFHEGGWRVVFLSEAQAIHYCGASSDRAPTRFYVEKNRANLQYFKKHHSAVSLVGFWLAIWLHQLVRIAGYSLLFLFRKTNREIAAHKVKRSATCLLWLMRLKNLSEVR
jgi:GT2 family glycosyltransferase